MQGCNLTDLQHHGRVALVDGLSLMSSHFVESHGANHCGVSTSYNPNSETQAGIPVQKFQNERLGFEPPNIAGLSVVEQQSEPSILSPRRPHVSGTTKKDDVMPGAMEGLALGDSSDSKVSASGELANSQANRHIDRATSRARGTFQEVKQDGDDMLHSLMHNVQSAVEGLGCNPRHHPTSREDTSEAVTRGRRVCLVIDDVSVLEVLAGGDSHCVAHFLSWCRSLQPHGHVSEGWRRDMIKYQFYGPLNALYASNTQLLRCCFFIPSGTTDGFFHTVCDSQITPLFYQTWHYLRMSLVEWITRLLDLSLPCLFPAIRLLLM